jgi:Tfp pilus assembly protein PilF
VRNGFGPRGTQPKLSPAQTVQRAKGLAQQGRWREADALCRKILAAAPDHFEALHVLCHVNHHAGRVGEAIGFGRKALNQRPDSVDAMQTLGYALAAAGRVDEAVARYEKALVREPRHVGLLNNLGGILLSENRFDEARRLFERAVAADPNHVEAEINLGWALLASAQPLAAIEHYRRGKLLGCDAGVADYCEANAQLLAGNFAEGWKKYEAGRTVKALGFRPWPGSETRWLGDAELAGKTIILHAEQGLGDTIQFCRYVPIVAAHGARVTLTAPGSLVSLLQTLSPNIEVRLEGGALPRHDFHAPLMSLPLAFGTVLETIPKSVPYLSADPARAAQWQARLESLRGRRVGLVWFGSSHLGKSAVNNIDRRRSMPFAALAPLAEVSGASFVSLQLGKPAHPAAALPRLVVHDWTAELKDFSDTAALIAGLDLVISVDTSTAHLAGALGKPVWLMNRFDTEWRWLLDRDDSPWYPTLRQFRQPKPGDWNSVVANVAQALAAFARD